MQAHSLRIIGIDPGLRNMGWGVLEKQANALRFVAAGTLHSDNKMSLAARLCRLYEDLRVIIELYRPQEAAVEHIFVNKDAGATLKLGQARGIALLAPARFGLPVAEYAPNAVKKAVIGIGHGDKTQIHVMIKTLMPKAECDSPDAADALAVAVCHAHNRQGNILTRRQSAL